MNPIMKTSPVMQQLWVLLLNMAVKVKDSHGVKERLTFEEIQLVRYFPPGGSYVGMHQDTVPSTPRSHLRKLSLTLQLNQAYNGKGVLFRDYPEQSCNKGDAIFFNPEDWHHPASVEQGERWALVIWYYDRDSDFSTYPALWPSNVPIIGTAKVPADINQAFKAINKPCPAYVDLPDCARKQVKFNAPSLDDIVMPN
jgi:hypothetical protein